MDSAYRGNVACRDREKSLAHPPHALGAVLRRHCCKLVEIVPGAEVASFAAQHDCLHIWSDLVDLTEQCRYFAIHGLVDGIGGRSVKTNVSDARRGDFDFQMVE